MYVPVGDITDFLDGDDFYGKMAQRFAAGDSFQDRYLASAAANVIGAETQNAIDIATGALNRARDGAAGRDGYNPFDNPFVLNKVVQEGRNWFNQGGDKLYDETSLDDLKIWETDPTQIDLLNNGGIDYGYI